MADKLLETTWTILKVLQWTANRFSERGISSARLDAEVLLAHVLGMTRVGLYTSHDKPLQQGELATYKDLIRRRLAGEPVAYLTGRQEFWSLPLKVDPRVLIPRRDTETLVEVALAVARPRNACRIADVATGSGAVALALAKELPQATVVATDASPGALEVARENADQLGLSSRVELREGDLVSPLDGTFDLIVSNPPYVPTDEIATLAPEVRREPRAALDGGSDGLFVLRRLVPAAMAFLAPDGRLAVEHAHDQGEAVARLFQDSGYIDVVTTKDLAGVDRVTAGRKRA
ncbi:MAG: peptide chain release factor N(5)-glutamine methyltransferase [Deltaproteobacteria bacterium]|nr:peptide chain release factor N(5)-glutamine methyltransferase [Deltaproteobacteria bacterium]